MRSRVLWALVFCLLPLVCHAKTLQEIDRYATPQTVAGIAHDPSIQSELLQLLGPDYQAFSENFQVWAAPAKLRDGGLFVEGWQKGAFHKKTSVFVVYPDGRLYAAYIGKDSKTLRYYTNATDYTNELPPALRVWYRILGHPVNILYLSATPSSYPSSPREMRPSAGVGIYALSQSDQDAMRSVAVAIWGQTLANGWNMNEDVGDVLAQATDAIMTCSAAFALVPKPSAMTPPGWFWVIHNSVSIVAYVTGVSGDHVYQSCVSTAALSYRSAIEMASMGI